ncbi:tRNA (adenosine(37)-N6)-dimethylallyltransferase MiaA [Sporolactobacillus vineae]|uniref:tRNA (adenosine(37)-N6)-dimethylallyltransferase MiaA n=1 Tax=Sporolactobacillus vineae TaxID=444463 RepID=UPI000289195B|nr:tRNA (adenosine(37)-N6)-dimethylallyltransferase MiaA [Sporolactobacillus vineae]
MKPKLVVLVGPTAVGKTAMGVELATQLNGEIINGDAFQIYRGMDIGTAKVTREESRGIRHHLIDIRDPDQAYSAADYQRDARAAVAEIAHRGKMPIIVGGTGFYIKAAVCNYQFSENGSDPDYRQALKQRAEREGSDALHHLLQSVDPVSASRIHPNNVQRVIRALEVVHLSGRPASAKKSADGNVPLYPMVCIGLTMERPRLYRRIDRRVDKMMEAGLLDEVHGFYLSGLEHAQSMQAIGYKEFFPYFEHKRSLAESIEKLKQNSRHYAKRQFTWFRGQMDVHWFDADPAAENFTVLRDRILDCIAGGSGSK